jgi:hypothetical protein
MYDSESFEPSESFEDETSSDIEPDDIEDDDTESDTSEVIDEETESFGLEEVLVTEETVEMVHIDLKWYKGEVESDRQKKFKSADGMTSDEDRFRKFGFLEKNALFFFFAMFPMEFWRAVTKNSNSYAEYIGENGYTKIEVWETLLFVAILLHAVLKRTKRIEQLWSRNKLLYSKFFSSIPMTYSRFKIIRRFLHISEPGYDATTEPDKYSKIRLMKDTLIENSTYYHPYSQKTS